ncbi:MAG: beta-ketoacyl-ACP synthase II [Candidatus Hydrogenedentes bacterium]|nr:beta-ketoacyl-ACP synthase II [Candidatus Hydrogenedentota bacterium]
MATDVVVTGMGVVSPVGNDIETFWKNLCAGQSGVRLVAEFEEAQLTSCIAGQCEARYPADLSDKDVRRRDRYALFAMSAADQAWAQSGLDIEQEDSGRCGVVIGSGIGGFVSCQAEFARFLDQGPRRVSPLTVPKMLTNIAGADVAIRLGLRGPNKAVVSACSTGAQSISDAATAILAGQADVMVAGGTEASLTPFAMAGFCAMRALSRRNDEPERASRPFDADRDGFIMSEGAGIVVLESEAHARARGAAVLGRLAGYAETCDAYHITAPRPDGSGAVAAMRGAMEHAGITPADVDYFNAHGTSTQLNDVAEAAALVQVFGDAMPPVSSTKSVLGHQLGAAGSVEAIVCLLSIRDGIVPPSINYDTPDPECPVNLVAHKAQRRDVAIALSNSLGFGGHNSTLVFSKV